MRKLSVLAAVILFGIGGTTATASTQQIAGKFSVFFPKAGQQNHVYPCPPDVFCGVGALQGFGPAELDVFDGNFQPIPNSNCLSFDKEDDVTLLGTTSTLVLVGSGKLCFPGASGSAPSSSSDYGRPSHWTSSLTIDGGLSTGVFSGATGSGTETFTVAGGVGVWHLAVTLTT